MKKIIFAFFLLIANSLIYGINTLELFFPKKNESSIVFSQNTFTDCNSFPYSAFESFTISQKSTAAKLNQLMQPSAVDLQWATFADQLNQRNIMPLCKENAKALTSAFDYINTHLHECTPLRVESSSWLRSMLDNTLDFFQGVHETNSVPNLAHMIESLVNLCTVSFTKPELQQLLAKLQTDVKPLLLDTQGSIKIYHTRSEAQKLKAIIHNFNQKLEEWLRLHGFEQCALDALNSQNPYYGPFGMQTPIPEQYLKTNGQISPAFADLTNKPHFKDLFELKNLCDQGNFEKAYQIVQKYSFDPEGLRSIGDKNYYTEYYLKRFYKVHDQRGIEKKYLADSYCQKLSNLPLSQKPSIYNPTLAKRDATKTQILENCSIRNPSEHTLKIIYEVIDRYHDPFAIADYLCSTLNADHPDPQVRATYHDLFNNGKIKFFESNSKDSYTLPSQIENAEFAAERVLLNKLYLCHADQNTRIKEVVFHIKNGCSNNEQATMYRSLAHTLANSILQAKAHILSIIPDFSASLPPSCEHTKVETAKYILSTATNVEVGTADYVRLTNLCMAYKEMANGNQIVADLLSQSIGNGSLPIDLTNQGSIGSYLKLKEDAAEANSPNFLNEFINAFQDYAKNGRRTLIFNETANATFRVYCIAHNIPVERYENFEGDQIQFITFKISRLNVQKAAELFAHDMNPTLRKVYEWGSQSNFLAYSFIKVRDYTNAINLTTLAYKAFEYVDAACNQAGHIIVQTVAGIADGFKDMPARLQEILIQIDKNIQEFRSLNFIAHQQPETHYIANIKQFLQHPIQGFKNGCRTIKEKTIAIGKHLYAIGIRGVSKAATQTTIEIYVLQKAVNLMEAGRHALLAETQRIAQPAPRASNSERFIFDAEISQIEMETLKTSETIANTSMPLTKMEQAQNPARPIKFSLTVNSKADIKKIPEHNKILCITDYATKKLKNGFKLKETIIYIESQQRIIQNKERFSKLNLRPISNNDLKHLINNHTKYGSVANNRATHKKESLFNDNVNIIELILDAWEYGTAVEDGVKVFDAGKIIGENKGIPTSKIWVSLNGDKSAIRTAFPK